MPGSREVGRQSRRPRHPHRNPGGGYLGQISAGANVLAYTFDAAGELASVVRGGQSLTNTYDGRGFLSQASDGTSGGYVKPTYSSAGLLLSQERLPSTGGTTERIDVLYFAGRPAAIWKKVGAAAATTTYVTTDQLGAPMFALNPAGTELWKGGFEPFGRDWQEGTANDALTKGIFLRLPGQWDDTLFGSATLGADSYYNVFRWYEQVTSRFESTDPADRFFRVPWARFFPMGLDSFGIVERFAPALFESSEDTPILVSDPLGLGSVFGPGGVVVEPIGRVVGSCFAVAEALRDTANARWPTTQQPNDFMRHCSVSCELDPVCGGTLTRALGWANEVMGFLRGARRGNFGGFSPGDLGQNEAGIHCSRTRRNCSCEDCCQGLGPGLIPALGN